MIKPWSVQTLTSTFHSNLVFSTLELKQTTIYNKRREWKNSHLSKSLQYPQDNKSSSSTSADSPRRQQSEDCGTQHAKPEGILPSKPFGKHTARQVRDDIPVVERTEDHALRRFVPVEAF